MTELDFSNIYSSTGKIIQQRYAQKAVDAASTILAMRNSKGAVLVVAKPIASKLYVQESDHRIEKISENVYMAYTGLLPDGLFIADICQRAARGYKKNTQSPVNASFFRETLGNHLYMFTQYQSVRVVGASFLSIMKEGAEYRVIGADCSGKTSEYRGYACGTGDKRAQTELEKLELETMEVKDMIDSGIKTLYLCHDALSDTKFSIEVGVISDDTDGEFVRLAQSSVDQIAEKYKDISMDGDDE